MIYLKLGVEGDLSIRANKARGEVARLYETKGNDLIITSQREGNHGYGSLHYNGNAFDFRKADNITKRDIADRLGNDFDVVEHATHMHVEYDPK